MRSLQIAGIVLLAAMSASIAQATPPVRPPADAIEGRKALEAGMAAEKAGDFKRAIRFYFVAVRNENFDAAKRIGDIYWDGKGEVPKDRSEAARYYSIAEKNGVKINRKK